MNEIDSEEHPALRDLPLLRFLSAEVRRQVVARFVPAAHPFGSVIVREGEPADAFYVLVSGRARVVKAILASPFSSVRASPCATTSPLR